MPWTKEGKRPVSANIAEWGSPFTTFILLHAPTGLMFTVTPKPSGVLTAMSMWRGGKTQNGLAISRSEVLRLTRQGMAVCREALSNPAVRAALESHPTAVAYRKVIDESDLPQPS